MAIIFVWFDHERNASIKFNKTSNTKFQEKLFDAGGGGARFQMWKDGHDKANSCFSNSPSKSLVQK